MQISDFVLFVRFVQNMKKMKEKTENEMKFMSTSIFLDVENIKRDKKCNSFETNTPLLDGNCYGGVSFFIVVFLL